MSTSQAYGFEARPTFINRLRWRLFPRPPRPLITNDARTFITTEIHAHVDWLDRFRVLVTGRVRLTVLTYTDVEVKEADSRSVFWVE